MSKAKHVAGVLSTGGQVVLGLLLDGPRSGYELVRAVERSVAHFWPITKAHVYAELPRLAAAGLTEGERVVQEGAPDKVVFAATAAGREAFRTWLTSAELGEPRLHHPLLLKLFFAQHMTKDALLTLLRARRLEVGQSIRSLTSLAAAGPKRTPRRWTLRYGVLRLEAELAFLDELEAEVEVKRRPR